MKKFVVLSMVLFLVVGCATVVPTPMQSVVTLSSGDKVEYVIVDAQNPAGIDTRVVDRYIKDPKTGQVMVTKDGFSGTGIGNAFMQGGFAGLAQSAGMIGGAALLRPSNTNVSQTGGGVGSTVGDGTGGLGVNATGGAASAVGGAGGKGGAGGSAVSGSSATAKAAQFQGQAQGQVQGQLQRQYQINKGKGWTPPGQEKK